MNPPPTNWTMTADDHATARTIFVLAACMQLVYVLLLPLSLSIDSYGYLSYAAHPLAADTPIVRTPGYPLLIALTAVPWLDSMLILIAVQLTLAACLPVVAFYALRPSGRVAALTVAALALVFPYPYTVPLQMMSETAYLSGLALATALLAVYLERRSLRWLFATLAAIAVTSEVRPSATFLYAAVVAGAGLQALLTRERRALEQAGIALLLAASIVGVRGAITERNTANIAPFFVWHWMGRCELSNGQSCVSPEYGPATKAMFEVVRQMLTEQRFVYDAMASERDIRGGVVGIRSEFRDYTPASIERLTHDLAVNTKENTHRGPALILALWNYIGVTRTGALMRPVILETLTTHPEVVRQVADKFRRTLFINKNMLAPIDGMFVLSDNLYWFFVPHSLAERDFLDSYPGGSRLYVEWLYGLEERTGRDPAAKEFYGRTPESSSEATEAATALGNRSALAMYWGSLVSRHLVLWTCLGSFPFLVLAWASRQRVLATATFIAFWGLIVTSYFSQNSYRQILMHTWGLFPVIALGVQGAVNIMTRGNVSKPGVVAPQQD